MSTMSSENPYFLVRQFNCCLTGNVFAKIEHISINTNHQPLLSQVAQQHQQYLPITTKLLNDR